MKAKLVVNYIDSDSKKSARGPNDAIKEREISREARTRRNEDRIIIV